MATPTGLGLDHWDRMFGDLNAVELQKGPVLGGVCTPTIPMVGSGRLKVTQVRNVARINIGGSSPAGTFAQTTVVAPTTALNTLRYIIEASALIQTNVGTAGVCGLMVDRTGSQTADNAGLIVAASPPGRAGVSAVVRGLYLLPNQALVAWVVDGSAANVAAVATARFVDIPVGERGVYDGG